MSKFNKNDPVLTRDLSGDLWKLEGCLPGRGLAEKFPEINHDHMGDMLDWSHAHVPGDVFTDLWRIGRIDDPHYARNSVKAKWVNEYEWWYMRHFNVPEEMQGRQIELTFEGVDYSCDVYLNGSLLGTHEGMFVPFSFNITDGVSFEQLRRGRNLLAVCIHPAPRRYSRVAGRKPAWHGDYWMSLVPTGIWKPVRLNAYTACKLSNVYVKSKLCDNSAADLTIQLETELQGDAAKAVQVDVCIQGENFESPPFTLTQAVELEPGTNENSLRLQIPDAQLWYPWDMGDQNLYVADITLGGNDGELLDAHQEVFGIRELRMEMNPGFSDEQVEHPWTVMINGKRHFVRSGTWGGPPDIFFGRATKDKYEELIRLAKAANMNNLRIFGWHPTEIPYFYELCNREGITVWQDILPIASLSLPEEDAYREAIFSDAISVVKQLRNHPCMIIIEGGEEILMSASDPAHNLRLMNELGEAVKPYTDLHYIPVSPLSDEVGVGLGFKPNESVHANGLFYGEGESNMESYFRRQDFAAVPELAISSCPNVSSIEKFIPKEELWPPGPSWGHHWADFDVFRTFNYEVLGSQSTAGLQEFVEATQVSQGVIFQYGLEYFRRRKPKTSAICICHYITFAPDMKWGIVDYFQETKKSYDYVRLAYQPLLVSLDYERRRWMPGENFMGSLWVVNDLFEAFSSCSAEVVFRTEAGDVVKRENVELGEIAPDSSKAFTDITCKVPGALGDRFYVDLELQDSTGSVISTNRYLMLVADEDVDLPELKRIGREAIDKKEEFGACNYLRYFDGFKSGQGENQFGTVLPAVNEFRSNEEL